MRTLPVFLLVSILLISSCNPQVTTAPVSVQTTEPNASVELPTSNPILPTAVETPVVPNTYTNNAFGISFQYPADWFGPDEYLSGQTLRVEVGSDIVYPYGNPPEQPSNVKNSYNVVVLYYQDNQNPFWKDTYQSLQNLGDGESLTDARSSITRVKQFEIGAFTGFEYIFTLPESAQTEHVYGREIMLFDETNNDLLTIMGQPNNVDINGGSNWRDVYKSIDEANLPYFNEIVESITIK